MGNLLLYDIDGTLLARSTGHRESFAVAFSEVYGVAATISMISPHGKTDPEIVAEVLRKCGLDRTEIDEGMEACLAAMSSYFAAVEPYVSSKLLPGVKEMLDCLDDGQNLLGLVTGNLEPIAYGKLAAAGIAHHFRLGGFGSDHSSRTQLVKIARERAAEQFGFRGDDPYLFGDTPQDMQAACAGEVTAIGVSTGIYGREDLILSGADLVIDGFTTRGMEKILRAFDRQDANAGWQEKTSVFLS